MVKDPMEYKTVLKNKIYFLLRIWVAVDSPTKQKERGGKGLPGSENEGNKVHSWEYEQYT